MDKLFTEELIEGTQPTMQETRRFFLAADVCKYRAQYCARCTLLHTAILLPYVLANSLLSSYANQNDKKKKNARFNMLILVHQLLATQIPQCISKRDDRGKTQQHLHWSKAMLLHPPHLAA